MLGVGLLVPVLLVACTGGSGGGAEGATAGASSPGPTADSSTSPTGSASPSPSPTGSVTGEASQIPELQQAILADDHERLVELLAEGADPDQTGPDGAAAVHLAAFSSNPDHLASLLEAGADMDLPHAVTGVSALNQALLNNIVEPFYLLMEAGADPNVADPNGGTPLHTAGRTNAGWAVLALLEAGADPLAETSRGDTFQDFYWGYNPAILNDRARSERAQLIQWLEENNVPLDPRAEQFRQGG